MKRLSLLCILTCLISACGQKGPLYLPDEQPQAIKAIGTNDD